MIRCIALYSSLLFLSAAAAAQSLPEPNSAPLSIYGNALRDAERKLFGHGVVLDTKTSERKAVTNHCGTAPSEIVWREMRRETDPAGGSHVFYRQHLVGEGLDAELVGSEIVVHRAPGGKLLIIGGRQFESIRVSGCPVLSATQAIEQARERVLLFKGQLGGQKPEPWTMNGSRNAQLARTNLKFVEIDGTFRPAWFIETEDVDGEPHTVVLDAENGQLLAIGEANVHGNCLPTTPQSFVGAIGIPVRSSLGSRTMQANVAARAGGYTHEGAWILTDPIIRLIVYQGVPTTGEYHCSPLTNQSRT